MGGTENNIYNQVDIRTLIFYVSDKLTKGRWIEKSNSTFLFGYLEC